MVTPLEFPEMGESQRDQWGNTLHVDKDGNVVSADLVDLQRTVNAEGYEAYKFAKQTRQTEVLGGVSEEMYGGLGGDVGATAPSAALPEGVPSYVSTPEFQALPDWLQKEIYGGDVGLAEGAGGAASIFSPQEERLMADLQNAVEVGSMSDEQAWKKIEGYWSEENLRSRRSEEAGKRGDTLLAGAFPGKTFPGTGPGGIGAKLAEKWGGPNLMPALEGIPMEQAQGVFGQAQQGMGLPAQLPPIQPPQPQMMNWQNLGQNLPSFGGGGNKYFEALLQQGRSQAPAL